MRASFHHHTGEQLVNNTGLDMATSRIVVMQRIWGKDHNFLRHHRPYYEQRLRADRIIRVGAYLVQGKTREARQEIANTHAVPHSYRVLAQLPGTVTKGLLTLRRVIKSRLRGVAFFGLFLPFDSLSDCSHQIFSADALVGWVQTLGIAQLLGA